jgi:hypothetical protein
MYAERINRASQDQYDVKKTALPNVERLYFSRLSGREQYRYLIAKSLTAPLEGEAMYVFIDLANTYFSDHGEKRLLGLIHGEERSTLDMVHSAIGGSRENAMLNFREAIRRISERSKT